MIKNISNLHFNVKNKISNKNNSFIKNILIGGVIFAATIISFSTKNSYEFSKSLDVVQNHYDSLKKYNNFKNTFDNTIYTDAMFRSDLEIFKKIYVENSQYFISNKSFDLPLEEFIMVKYYIGDNREELDKYIKKFNTIEVNDSNYLNIITRKQDYLRMLKNKSPVSEFKQHSSFFMPEYLANNFQSYLKEKKISPDIFYYSPDTRKYINNNRKNEEKMELLREQKNIYFNNILKEVRQGDYNNLKIILKSINSFKIEIANYEVDYNTHINTFNNLDSITFKYIEGFRNIYTKNGVYDPSQEPERNSKDEERIMSSY